MYYANKVHATVSFIDHIQAHYFYSFISQCLFFIASFLNVCFLESAFLYSKSMDGASTIYKEYVVRPASRQRIVIKHSVKFVCIMKGDAECMKSALMAASALLLPVRS